MSWRDRISKDDKIEHVSANKAGKWLSARPLEKKGSVYIDHHGKDDVSVYVRKDKKRK